MPKPWDDRILEEQIAYYRARAGEYDEWFYREGRSDRGSAANRAWFDETRIVAEALGRFDARGDVLELACGTGIWTMLLASRADSVTAVDASPEVMAINQAKLEGRRQSGDRLGPVRYVEADLFQWAPDRAYDVAVFGFWLSHVPPERFDAFWGLVRTALKPDGRFFFVDSLPDRAGTVAAGGPRPDEVRQRRTLKDGRAFEIVKVYYDAGQLEQQLRDLGFLATVKRSGRYFLYGYGSLGGH